jgi:hypothetical protein
MYDHIQVIIMSAGQPMARQLQEWLRDNQLDWKYGPPGYGIDLARQQITINFLRHCVPVGKTHLIGIDHDQIPIRETRHILRGDDELAYCGYCGRHGSRGHVGDGDFGAGCFRVSADLLNRMAQPWWQTTVVNGVRTECECQWFRKRAEAVGATSKMVGLIGHRQECVLIPSDAATGYSVVWDEELEAKHGSFFTTPQVTQPAG